LYGGYVIVEKGRANLGDEGLLIAVANTGHGEHDEFAGAASVRAWWDDLVGSGDGGGSRRIAPENVAMLRSLRDLVRSLALRNNGVDTEADPGGLERLDLRLNLREDLSLHPARDGDVARDVCATGVTALLRASARPGWPRFKACRGEDCRWVFVDASRNSSRRWCDMAGCGNRAKSMSFRRRQHADRRSPG
jgi:predicted RNA-binding Zn ribbon-like protein